MCIRDSSNNVYCVFCPFVTGAPSLASATIALTNVKAYVNQDIQTQTFGSVTTDQGRHLQGQACPYTKFVFQPGTPTILSSGTLFGLNGQKVSVTLGLPNSLTDVQTITISGYATTNTTAITASTSTDSNFPYFLNPDSSSVCKFGPTANATANPYNLGACTVTVTGGRITISGWSTSNAADLAQTSFTLILWGIIGSAQTSSNPASSYVFVRSTKTISSTDGIIDSTPYNTPGTWLYSNATTDFSITSTAYQRNYINAIGYIKWDFTFANARPLFQRDIITFRLDAFSTTLVNNVQSLFRCRITDQNDNILQIFQECSFSTGTPNSLVIKASSNLFFETNNAVWRVYLENIRVTSQTARGIYGSANYFTFNNPFQARATAGTEIVTTTLTALQSFPTGYPTIQKIYNQFGVFQDIAFNLTTRVPLNDTCRIAVVFPSYYQDGLIRGWGQPYCSIQGVFVSCNVTRGNQLSIVGPSPGLAAGANFTLRVQGVISSNRVGANSLELFFIVLSQDTTDSNNSVIYAGTVADTSGSAAAVGLIHVNLGQVSSSDTRSVVTYTWAFTLTADVPTTSAIQIIFPNNWGVYHGISSPSCKVYDWSDASKTALTGTQVISPPYVHLPVSTNISRNALLNIECSGIRNIDTPGPYRSDDIQLRVIDNNNNVVAQSAEHANNVDYSYVFFVRIGLVGPNFVGISTDMNAPSPLFRGQYSYPITLALGEISSRNFSLNVLGSNWALYPTAVNVSIGQPLDTTFRLGVATNVPLGVYGIIFTHTESTRYIQPPVVWVHVITGGTRINRTPDTVSAIVGSSTVPVVLDASTNPPFSDVTVTAVLDTTANFFSVSPASITLTTAKPFGSFVFKTLSVAQAGNSTRVSYTLDGTNKDSYIAPVSHSIQATADTNNQATAVPILVVSERSADTKKATSKIINFNIDKVDLATVYWCASFPGQSFTIVQLLVLGTNMTQLHPQDLNQIQCGLQTFAKGDRTITLTGLKPNTKYEVTAFANSQFNLNSTIQVFSFQTITNGGAITRVLFEFSSYPSATQRQTLLCELRRLLTVPAEKIVSIHGDYCNKTDAFYTQVNTSNGLAIYFYPSDTEDDTITKPLANNLNNIRNTLNTSLGSNPVWVRYSLDGTVLPYAPITTTGTVTVGDTYIYLTGTRMNQSGYIFVGLDSTNGYAPTPLQLKQGLGPSGTQLTAYSNFFYVLNGDPISQNFTGLTPNTTYTVFVATSNSDPSQTEVYTSVASISATTTSPAARVIQISAVTLFSSFILAILLSIIHLI
eukprot:TRINITY_DN35_c0_g1_i9.p1 TRINITY_DN35_c0_g1~~TRINITY_DN35_c0_g1_i9.p1  ORF type:complete len:1279 (-),score=238.31 TRINITY_DN35_c0_g1_i9:40-3876(-)